MRSLFLALPFVAASLLADSSPYSVSLLVQEPDAAVLAASLHTALDSPVPLVRATAARVVQIRASKPLLPQLRELARTEQDATAAREEIRALAMIGEADDLAIATATAARFPSGMDDALAMAVGRRGGMEALNTYFSSLRNSRMRNAGDFFRQALWGRGQLLGLTGARLLAAHDERGWRGLLSMLLDSGAAMNDGVMAASLGADSEDMRSASVWYLVRGYANEPSALPDLIKTKIVAPRSEQSSNREDFGMVLLARMIGEQKKNDPRWLKYLEGPEVDQLLEGRETTLPYLTDEEYRVRFNRCEMQSRICALPMKRTGRIVPSQMVAPPAVVLPEVLPAGLTEAVMNGAHCRGPWIGIASATVDLAGRVGSIGLDQVATSGACRHALDSLLRLSLATNTSLASPLAAPVVLVLGERSTPCLDEDGPESENGTFSVGGTVQAPIAKKKVEPVFPESARRKMSSGKTAVVQAECTITKTGCVRNVRLLSQSPFPELNGAALVALSQWTFIPGSLDGTPVDVRFNLTVSFNAGR